MTFYEALHDDGGCGFYVDMIQKEIRKQNNHGHPVMAMAVPIPREFRYLVDDISKALETDLGIPKDRYEWNGPNIMVTWGKTSIADLKTQFSAIAAEDAAEDADEPTGADADESHLSQL